MPTNDYSETASQYGEAEFVGVIYLAFRDVPMLIERYATGTRALDYGCGAGRATRLLKRNGLDVVGVDISPSMLEVARAEDPDGAYHLIENGEIPFEDDSFDLAFSSFVFFEIPTIEEMTKAAAGIRRALKPGGHFILLIGSEHLYDHEWTTVKVDYPENKQKQSGSPVRVFLADVKLELTDYYWTDADYRKVLTDAGFSTIDLHQPLGRPDDGIEWISEDKVPPFSIYVAGK
ncbi:MAG: class I SAM-dependent methyltransferase [Alphaproteobacteria bacterium]